MRYNTPRSKRIAVCALLACFIAVSLISEASALIHSCHEHSYGSVFGGCAPCAHIRDVGNIFKQIGAVAGGLLFLIIQLFSAAAVLFAVLWFFSFQTLVNSKIRMNN